MRLVRASLTIALACLFVMAFTPTAAQARTWAVPKTATASAPTSLEDFETKLMVEINEARKAHGLRRITRFDGCTDRMAESWGRRIVRTGAFEHRDQNQVIRRCRTSWAGETLIRGADLSPQSMVTAWLNSPGHRVILLSKRAKLAGVAVASDQQGRLVGVLNVVRLR